MKDSLSGFPKATIYKVLRSAKYVLVDEEVNERFMISSSLQKVEHLTQAGLLIAGRAVICH